MVSFGRSMVSFVVWLSLSFMGGRGCKLLGIVYFTNQWGHMPTVLFWWLLLCYEWVIRVLLWLIKGVYVRIS